MARYPLNLPPDLKRTAESLAEVQGISLNQFILWALAEKVGALAQRLDDPAYPHVTYRRGAAGVPTPVVRGSGVRVQSLAIAARRWGLTPQQLAGEYGLTMAQIDGALAFAAAHEREIELALAAEEALAESPDA
jgi:uncharacterized protein (DUF433 family)